MVGLSLAFKQRTALELDNAHAVSGADSNPCLGRFPPPAQMGELLQAVDAMEAMQAELDRLQRLLAHTQAAGQVHVMEAPKKGGLWGVLSGS
jgi:hypothetical protein